MASPRLPTTPSPRAYSRPSRNWPSASPEAAAFAKFSNALAWCPRALAASPVRIRRPAAPGRSAAIGDTRSGFTHRLVHPLHGTVDDVHQDRAGADMHIGG